MSAADRIREEGEAIKAKKTALNMLKKNMDVDTISEVTELPVDQIEEIKAENQENFDDNK